MAGTRLLRYLKTVAKKRIGTWARENGIPRPMVWEWAHGKKLPGRRWALKIQALTDDKVPASSWDKVKIVRRARGSGHGVPSAAPAAAAAAPRPNVYHIKTAEACQGVNKKPDDAA